MVNQDQGGNLFGKWEIHKDTWCISNRWSNFMYLLIGKEKALLIDSGTGTGNLKEFVKTITDKPVMVACTHGHYDHTGGNYDFGEAWMHRESEYTAVNAFKNWGDSFYNSKEFPEVKINYLEDGDVIDLGGRRVKVLHIPAHHEGSIAFIDENTRSLFTGDELESGQVLLFVRRENLPYKEAAAMHKKNMERLKSLRSEYDYIWPGHNGLPLLPDRYLDDFITLDEMVINGTAEESDNTGGYGWMCDMSVGPFAKAGHGVRASYGVASVVYVKD